MPGELGLPAAAAALALLGERLVESQPVDGDAVFGRQLDRQVDGKAVRVVESEGDVAGQPGCIRGQLLGTAADDPFGPSQRDEGLLQLDGPGIERPPELRLLAQQRTENLLAPLDEEWIRGRHDVDDDRCGLGEEWLAPSKQPTVTDRAADELAEDVAAALVRGQDAVGNEERRGARMVGDDLVAEPLLLERIGIMAEELPHPGVDRQEQVRVVVRRHLLDDGREPLEAHAGVDARERQREAALRPLVELHEHEVPDFEPARAVLAVVRDAPRALAQVGPAIEVDLAAWPARAGVRHSPEVLVVADLDVAPLRHPLRRQADLGAPDVPGDVVVGVRRGAQPLAGDPQVPGQEIPGEMDRLALEVVAEAPVAEHLEEGVVVGVLADVVEVVVLAAGADALLRVGRPLVRPGADAEEHVLELVHAGVGEQERRIVERHHAGRRHEGVAVLLDEEVDELLADFVGGRH